MFCVFLCFLCFLKISRINHFEKGNNILKCIEDLLISNIPALNEVKSLDNITYNLQIPHIHSTDFANEVNFNSGPTSGSSQRFRGRGSSRFARGRR